MAILLREIRVVKCIAMQYSAVQVSVVQCMATLLNRVEMVT